MSSQEKYSSKDDMESEIIDLNLLKDFSLMLCNMNTIEENDFAKISDYCGNIFNASHCALILKEDKKEEFQIVSAWEKNDSENVSDKLYWKGMRYTSDSPLGIAITESISDKSLIPVSNVIISSYLNDSLGDFSIIFDKNKSYIIPLFKSDTFFGIVAFKLDKINNISTDRFEKYSSYISQVLSSNLFNSRLHKVNEEIKYYLSNLIQNSRDAIISLDLSGKIKLWNNGAESIFGHKEEDIIGKNFYYLFSSESRNKVTTEWIELLTGRIITCEEAKGLRKDGSKISVSYTLSPINDISGYITGISIIFRDLTDKKQLEFDIFESKGKLQSVFDNLQDYILLFDLEHRIMMANKVAINLSGLAPRELIGSKKYILLDDINNDLVVNTIDTKKSYSKITKYDNKKFSLMTIPVIDSLGKMTGVILHAKSI